MKSGHTPSHAFTLVELLIVIAIVAVLAALQIPALASTKSKVQRIHCSDNLKRISVAFVSWAASHNDRLPMAVPPAQGGASGPVGQVARGATFASNINPLKGVFGIFVVMSNELTTPKILFCPADSRAGYNQGTIFGDTTNSLPGFYSDFQVSYAIGVDANFTAPNMFLNTDANLGDASTPPLGNNVYGEAASSRKFIALGTNVFWTAASPGWANSTHSLQGNVTLTDGSVQNFNTTALRNALNQTGDSDRALLNGFVKAAGSSSTAKNRLQFP
jgi:prepilin-type N-terminal cleavage/methylation domain-containing protein